MFLKISIIIFTISFFTNWQVTNGIGNLKAYYECTEPLSIDSTLFEINLDKVYFSFNKNLIPDDIVNKGFIWIKDDISNYFTAYLINTSDTVFHAAMQDGSLMMIQEALNENAKWKPIEYWVFSGCGNSYFNSLELEPNKYIMIPIKYYKGNFKTKIRLKMRKDKSIFYSKSFDGSIDKSQFSKQKKDVKGILYDGPASYLDDKYIKKLINILFSNYFPSKTP